jgi:hypothetical protein
MRRLYRYVGPEEIRLRAAGGLPGVRVETANDLAAWARAAGARPGQAELLPVTFVVDELGELRVADRGTEHVACAAGGAVLSAGELFLAVPPRGAEVVEASNQSTGYCPELESWPAVAAALDRAGVPHPGRFTWALIFRRCPKCGQRNVVKDGWFVCSVYGSDLPAEWNFDEAR